MNPFRPLFHWLWGFFVSPLIVDVGFSRQIAKGKEHGYVKVKIGNETCSIPFIASQTQRLQKPNKTIVKGILKQARLLTLEPLSVTIKVPGGSMIYNNQAIRQR